MCVLNDRTNGLLITSLPSGRSVLRLPFEPGAPELIFDRRSRPGDRAAVMRALGVERLHIHHAVYNETWLDAFVRELGLPYDITLHDYYFLAPQAHLLDETGRFVGDERLDDEVLARPFWSNAEPVSLRIWRTRAHRLLVGAQRRLAPSHDLARRFLRIYPDLAIQVVPHHEMPRPETHPVSLTPCAPEEPVRVLLLGALGVNKGSTILRACAELARQSGAPLDFHVLGALDINPPPGVTVHGLYEMDQLPACIARIAPHLAWFPVQGPESYSYTLSEAMQAGLPILASALGSFPERLAGRAWSWLHPWKASPENWLERLLEIRTRHLIGRAPAAAPGNPPAWDTTFYSDRYMEGL
jgi:glycosyltransferase involved in cell wall biosynthesis